MKRKLLAPIVITLMIVILMSFGTNDDPNHNIVYDNPVVTSKQFNGNNISTWYRTNGSFNRDPVSGNSGFEWPKGSGKYARYASGLWIGCISGNDTLTAVAEYSYDYKPGYVDNNGNPQSDSTYRIYKISQGDFTSYDYLHWPALQGAYLTSEGKPYQMGIQTMFFVYTDAYPHASGSTSLRSLKAQIFQTNWAYNPSPGSTNVLTINLSNTIFTEYRIINRSNEIWNETYLGLWTDDDLGDAGDDRTGCDTNINLQYTYNADDHDGIYGNAPPAVGTLILKGGDSYTGNLLDTVKFYHPYGSNNQIIKPGYKDQKMTVANYYNNTNPPPTDPINNTETYRVLRGWWGNGNRWVNPLNGDTSNTPFSGDPVTGTGWLFTGARNTKSMIGTGPVTVNPGDTITFIAAQVIAKGNSNLNSVTALKKMCRTLQKYFDNNEKAYPQGIAPDVSTYAPGNGTITLSWDDSAERYSFQNILSRGTYKFQGYNIYQINSYSINPSSNDTVLIKTFDIRDGITDIRDSVYIDQYQGIIYGVVQHGSDNGISRSISLTHDTISNKNFINGTEYKFAVTSYYYDSTGGIFSLPKVNHTEKKILKTIPQDLASGIQIAYGTGDTIRTGQKDLGAMPIIADPVKLINANYTSSFGGTNQNPNWTLSRTANGTTTILFQDVYDFTGTFDSAKTSDGIYFIHQMIRDSGIVRDPDDALYNAFNWKTNSIQKAWTYYPNEREWFTGPDTNAVRNTSNGGTRQFDSRSLGMSFPTVGSFRNTKSRIFANGKQFQSVTSSNTILTGGPLRKIKIVFGDTCFAFRFLPDSSNALSTPYKDTVKIPFSVYHFDELDSTGSLGARKLNVGFVDSNRNAVWDPNTSVLGDSHYTYIFASNYDPANRNYVNKNPGLGTPVFGLPAMDVMYIWLPRLKTLNGAPLTWSVGDTLTITPYRITRPEFVPGYPVKYSWNVTGTNFNNHELASAEVKNIKAFPNPYYGFSELEFNDASEKFIYFSHLPASCNIFIYTLDGVLVKKIERNNSDPNNSLEKWDLKNSDGSNVASGMYLIYVDCKEFGVKTLKIAVFQR